MGPARSVADGCAGVAGPPDPYKTNEKSTKSLLAALEVLLADLGALLAALGVLLGPSWPLLGCSWGPLGLSWDAAGCSWTFLAAVGGPPDLYKTDEKSRKSLLAALGVLLGPSWPLLGG